MMKTREDIFTNGIGWKVFRETEKEFISFIDIVPLVLRHKNIYSFKLFNIILSLGSHIDNVFKAMGKYPKFQNEPNIKKMIKEPNIGTYRMAFEPIYHLSSKKIYIKKEPIYSLRNYHSKIIPFSGFHKSSPLWWKNYNDLKHSWFEGDTLVKANMENTLRALASLFLLLVRHEASWDCLIDYGVIRGGYFDEAREYEIKADIKRAFDKQKDKNQSSTEKVFPFREVWAESKLFIYRFPFWQRWLIEKEAIKNMKKWIYRQFYAPLKF